MSYLFTCLLLGFIPSADLPADVGPPQSRTPTVSPHGAGQIAEVSTIAGAARFGRTANLRSHSPEELLEQLRHPAFFRVPTTYVSDRSLLTYIENHEEEIRTLVKQVEYGRNINQFLERETNALSTETSFLRSVAAADGLVLDFLEEIIGALASSEGNLALGFTRQSLNVLNQVLAGIEVYLNARDNWTARQTRHLLTEYKDLRSGGSDPPRGGLSPSDAWSELMDYFPEMYLEQISRARNIPREDMNVWTESAYTAYRLVGFRDSREIRYDKGKAIARLAANAETHTLVTFPDPNLEAAVREAIGKPAGDILHSDLEELTRLDAEGRGISNLSGLEAATSITTLDLDQNEVSDLTPLEGLTELQYLVLIDNQVSDLSPLDDLDGLNILLLDHNQISSLSPLDNLTELKTLWLRGNQISDLSPLADLTGLEFLSAGSNRISDLTPLENLTNLEILSLGRNEISDVSPLRRLSSLEYLSINGNAISDFSPLGSLAGLKKLSIGSNPISDLAPLDRLSNLESLHLNRLGLSDSDLRILESLTNLERLSLPGNEIADLQSLAGLTNIRDLALFGNEISDISPLLENEGIGEGDRVRLQRNPLSQRALCQDIPRLEERGVRVEYTGTCSD